MISKEQNRAWAMTMAVAAVLLCSGCSENLASSTAQTTATGTTTASSEQESETTMAEETDNVTVMSLTNTEQRVDYDEDDYTSTYATFDAEIQLSGSTADVTGRSDAVQIADHVVTIQEGGTYRISGTWENGQLRVTGSEKVKLYLDGVSITNPNGAAILCENEKRTILSLAAETENILSDGTAAASAEEPAAIYTEDKLTINGNGTLIVNGVAANGIVCRNDLKITGGTIQVNAANNGIKGKDCIGICGGNITVTAGNDGLKATETDDPERGWIAVSGGMVTVTAEGDGMQAETDCWIDGGELHITTTGEIATSDTEEMPVGGKFDGGQFQGGGRFAGNAPMQQESELPSAEATVHQMANIITDNDDNAVAETDTTEIESASSKGVKAGGMLTITGGTVQVSSTDHCLHSTNSFFCSGGTLQLNSSKAKGISSHGVLTISDGSITIEQATEGIESKSDMEISGGTIRILQATDDGLNTGGGTAAMGFPMQQNDTTTATDTSEAESHNLTISGGSLYVCAEGDGIDSNGSITMTGGTVWVSGPVSGGDGAIDFETGMTMSGGSILALSNRGMMEYPSTPHYCTTNVQAQAGDFIAVCDADGNVLMGMQTEKAVSDVVYYGEQMENCQLILGGTYQGTLSEDNTATDGTVSGGTAAEGFALTDGTEQGSFSQGRFGNGGGMHPDGGQKPDFADGEKPDFGEGEMPEPPQDGFGNQNGEMPESPAGTAPAVS